VNYLLLTNNESVGRNPFWPTSILFWPVLLPLYIAIALIALLPRMKGGEEYSWKRP
jgi:hypothetical protein